MQVVINNPSEYEKAREDLFDYSEAEMAAATLLEILRDLKEATLADVVGDVLDDIHAIRADMLAGMDAWEKVWGGD